MQNDAFKGVLWISKLPPKFDGSQLWSSPCCDCDALPDVAAAFVSQIGEGLAVNCVTGMIHSSNCERCSSKPNAAILPQGIGDVRDPPATRAPDVLAALSCLLACLLAGFRVKDASSPSPAQLRYASVRFWFGSVRDMTVSPDSGASPLVQSTGLITAVQVKSVSTAPNIAEGFVSVAPFRLKQ